MTSNLTNSSWTWEVPTPILVLDIICIIIAIVGVLVNIVTAYTILRHKELRTAPYVFMANWAICDVLVLVGVHSFHEILWAADEDNHHFFVFFRELLCVLESTNVFFVFVATLDWCLAAFCPSVSKKYREKARVLIVSVWLTLVVRVVVLVVLTCLEKHSTVNVGVVISAYLVMFAFVLGLHLRRACQKCKPLHNPTTVLTMVTLFVLFWVPIALEYGVEDVLWIFYVLSKIGYLAKFVITFVGLYTTNKDFEAHSRDVFKALTCRS